MLNYTSPLEKLCIKLWTMAKANTVPLVSGIVSGLRAHMFVLSNKLMNADEIGALFSKGATIDSGRWALELLRAVFPDVSLPWLWGIITIVLISVAACIALRIFNIRHNFFRVLLPALFISFPSLTGTFCFMFTSSSYAVAFLLAILSIWVYVNVKNRALAWVVSCFLLAFSTGIYQAYIAISASFLVILMFQKLMDGEDAKAVLFFGVRSVAMLLVSLVFYYGCSLLAVKLSGGEFLAYAIEGDSSLPMRVLQAYNGFFRSLFSGYFGFVHSKLSFAAHMLGLAVCAVLIIKEVLSFKDIKKFLLALLCIGLLPLAMNCIYLISSTWVIHSLVLYSFVVIYVFAAVLLDRAEGLKLLCARDAAVVCLLLVVISNTFLSNKVYLKLHIQYENAFAFYTELMSQVYDTEGFDENKKLMLIGNQENYVNHPELDTGDLFGPSTDLVNVYTKQYFIRDYIGYTGEFATMQEIWDNEKSEEVLAMPYYPYEGSVKCVGDYIVVKFG